jgi:electron transfer flavoprotein alpha subunit
MSEGKGGILVFSEEPGVQRELLGRAQVEELPIGAVLLGSGGTEAGAELGRWGADYVYAVSDPLLADFNPETYTDALAAVIEEVQPLLVLVGATKSGLEVAGRVAERLQLGSASWCVDFAIDPESGQVTAECMIFSGVGKSTYRIHTTPAMATVAPGVFEAVGESGAAGQVVPIAATIREPAMRVTARKGKMGAGRRLEDAPVIVDVGQGMVKREDLELAESLASLLGGQVACTRPISSERDWFPEWLGLSGKKLSPDLCITLGVSGAIQHVIGIRDSKIIVAVNKDEGAGIFMQADYGVVADLYEFVPVLIEALRARSAVAA